MHHRAIPALAAAAALSACSPADHPAVSGPQFAHVQDLDGTPDLIVDDKRLADSWVIYDQTFSTTACSVVEGGVTVGDHRVLRFTVSTPNIGDADIFIGDPNVHIAAGDGHVWRSAKRGFCMIDVTPWNNNDAGVGSWVYHSCGRVGIPGNQGISVGYADTYFKFLGGQYFVLDGGDGQAPVPPGQYIIRITVNPPFTAAAGERCPFTDVSGFCHQLPERDFTNNVAEVLITIPDRTGKTGFGPGAGDLTNAELIDDENRPDK